MLPLLRGSHQADQSMRHYRTMAAAKRRSRKHPAHARKAAEADTIGSSPHDRAAKRRKVGPLACTYLPCNKAHRFQINDAAAAPSTHKAPSVEDDDEDEDSDTMSHAEAQEVADRVIPLLAVAPYSIAVATEHANEQYDGDAAGAIQAYAKVCGSTWTYYITSTNVNIGRASEPLARHSTASRGESSPGGATEGPGEIHIDLGPHKHVSRLHGNLFFESTDTKWYVHVDGRNGIRLNHMMLRRGQSQQISCGDILEIAGTEMMFVTANEKAVIHESYLRKLQEETSDDEIPGQPFSSSSMRGNHSQRYPPQDPSHTAVHTNGTTLLPAPPDFVQTTTPIRSARKPGALLHTPAVQAAMEMETNEDIDYSLDAYKDFKPSCSYSCMIGRAILSARDESMTLAGIYKWINANFAYYRHNKTNWKVCS